eukprot:1152235-Pelagomonas_calceolata.AAC.2
MHAAGPGLRRKKKKKEKKNYGGRESSPYINQGKGGLRYALTSIGAQFAKGSPPIPGYPSACHACIQHSLTSNRPMTPSLVTSCGTIYTSVSFLFTYSVCITMTTTFWLMGISKHMSGPPIHVTSLGLLKVPGRGLIMCFETNIAKTKSHARRPNAKRYAASGTSLLNKPYGWYGSNGAPGDLCTCQVSEGCPLSPLPFSIYLNDINAISEGIEGACTGTPKFHVSNLLYADDLCLTYNSPNNLQAMLSRLRAYARRKFLTANKKTLSSVSTPRPITCLPFFIMVRSCLTQVPSATWGCSLTNILICAMLLRKLSNPAWQ